MWAHVVSLALARVAERSQAMDATNSNAAPSIKSSRTFILRGRRVILDCDLARLYEVPTKRLNEQVRRHPERFPPDFAFLLSQAEWDSVRSQIAAAGSGRAPYRRFLPYAFTEHGALMAAGVVNSERAIQASIYIARASVLWGDG